MYDDIKSFLEIGGIIFLYFFGIFGMLICSILQQAPPDSITIPTFGSISGPTAADQLFISAYTLYTDHLILIVLTALVLLNIFRTDILPFIKNYASESYLQKINMSILLLPLLLFLFVIISTNHLTNLFPLAVPEIFSYLDIQTMQTSIKSQSTYLSLLVGLIFAGKLFRIAAACQTKFFPTKNAKK